MFQNEGIYWKLFQNKGMYKKIFKKWKNAFGIIQN